MTQRLLPIFLLTALLATAAADVIHLKNGQTLEGNLRKSDGGWTVTTPEGRSIEIAPGQVQSIEIKRGNPTTLEARSALESLRRAVDHLNDLDEIISRYQRFLQNTTDPAVAADARRDLAAWQQRRKEGMVRYGTQWVTPAQRQQLAAQALAQVSQARRLIEQGQLKAADAQLQDLVKANPDNAAALYLQGVVDYRQDKIVPARQAFLAANELSPNHAPTLNNLGVIYWRQKNPVGAVKYYNEAMRSDPLNKTVLDNTAEALHALSDRQRNNTIVPQAQRRFQSQDEALSKQLLKDGWHRWGATWVSDAQYGQLKQVEQQVQAKLDELAGRYNSVQAHIRRIDNQIAANNRNLRSISAQAYLPDPNGNWIYIGLPPLYYDLQNSNEKLKAQRADAVAELQRIQQSAKGVEQRLPVPKYTGIQHLIGASGAPLNQAVIPTTSQSTTRPSQ